MGDKSIQKRKYILETARTVFIQKGYLSVTMKDIVDEQKAAREAGEEVKKKPRSNAITRLLRRFWSAIAE